MALMKTRKPDPDELFVAWQSGGADIDGVLHAVSRGDRLRGDDPLVQRLGRAVFVEDGVPESEWPGVLGDLNAATQAAEAPPRSRPRIDPETRLKDLLVCRRAIVASKIGPVGKGVIVTRDDPRVAILPEAFVPLIETLG